MLRASGGKLVDLLATTATTAIHRIFILSTYSSNCTKVSEKKFVRSKIFYLLSENSPVGLLRSHEIGDFSRTRVLVTDISVNSHTPTSTILSYPTLSG